MRNKVDKYSNIFNIDVERECTETKPFKPIFTKRIDTGETTVDKRKEYLGYWDYKLKV